jgi:hypothetical protein
MVKYEPTYAAGAQGEPAAAAAHTTARLKRSAGPFVAGDVVEVQGKTTDGRYYCVGERGADWVRARHLEAVDEE